jgi:xanthine dehydrogenase accessory factor
MSDTSKPLILVRGAGDLASGVIVRLVRSGYRVAALEIERPTSIRRTVSLSEAMYEGAAIVEGVRGRRVADIDDLLDLSGLGIVPLLADRACSSLSRVRPAALVDAIIAKRNLGTRMDMAPVVIALGPGFEVGVDAHAVVETKRGHDLGRVLTGGQAAPDTGVPGEIAGFGAERVVHAPASGRIEALCDIGDEMNAGDPILAVVSVDGETDCERVIAKAPIAGVVRGLIRPGIEVPAGLKVADVDPRAKREYCRTVSDKARAVGGGVLEALLSFGVQPE